MYLNGLTETKVIPLHCLEPTHEMYLNVMIGVIIGLKFFLEPTHEMYLNVDKSNDFGSFLFT